jgi:NAD(P)-dependent dehydrogenase (short-subunit alcohol dehydrogenase family)
MGDRLKGRVAIVTGAGGGIGRGVALLLAEEGASVVVNDLGGNVDGTGASSGPADQVVAEIRSKGGAAVANGDTVAAFEGARNIVRTAIDNFGKVDILCHLAGILRDRMIFNMAEEEWDGVLAVHLKGAFNTVSNVVPHMIQQRYGRICLFSSGSGLGNTGQANYSAAKEGMVGLARALARELASYGISVNAIYPGGATRMTGTVPDSAREVRQARGVIGGGQMEGRAQQSEESRDALNNAPKAVYLCTEVGGQITGQVIGTSGWQMSLYSPRHVIRSIHKDGRWTVDELEDLVPASLAAGLVNPAPAPPPAEPGTG